MKIIRFPNYRNLQRKLFEYVDGLEDPYGYIFHTVNSYDYGVPREHRQERLLKMTQIKQMWDSVKFSYSLIRLMIMCHYRGQIIETSEFDSRLILADTVRKNAADLAKRLKEYTKNSL